MGDIENDLLNTKVKMVFGLEAQGHIPLIEEKLKTWWPSALDPSPFQIWRDISEKIGWIDFAVCDDYIKYLQRQNKNSTPNAKIQELIDEMQTEIDCADHYVIAGTWKVAQDLLKKLLE